MRSGLHPVVKHAENFDEVGLQHAIKNHVGWVCDRRLEAFVAAVAGVEASNAGKEFGCDRLSNAPLDQLRRMAALRQARYRMRASLP
jgi:hypothetical protein